MKPSWGMRGFSVIVLSFGLASCATVESLQNRNHSELLEEICSIGAQHQRVKGSLWLKADSREAKGQFPAGVRMDRPDHLILEVTNLLGGAEATIEVSGDKYSLKTTSGKSEKGTGAWGGLPLEWATTLVSGRFPCPQKNLRVHAKISSSPPGELRVALPSSVRGAEELYVYRLRPWSGRLWPYEVEWKRTGVMGSVVTFGFEDPEAGTHVPRRWSARSQMGTVKVRWKSREVD